MKFVKDGKKIDRDTEWDDSKFPDMQGENVEKQKHDFKHALYAIHKIYTTVKDLDEEKFVKHFKEFKEKTENTSVLDVDRSYVNIKRERTILKLPSTLSIHLNRLTYDLNGNMVMNNKNVPFPMEMRASDIFKRTHESEEDETYRLHAVIVH